MKETSDVSAAAVSVAVDQTELCWRLSINTVQR